MREVQASLEQGTEFGLVVDQGDPVANFATVFTLPPWRETSLPGAYQQGTDRHASAIAARTDFPRWKVPIKPS